MTAEELRTWQLEYDRIDKLLTRIEEAERAILRERGYPTDPGEIHAIVTEKLAPGTNRPAVRARDRGWLWRVMIALVCCRQARTYLAFGQDNPRLAAEAALLAGLAAGETTTTADIVARFRKAGFIRGAQKAADAAREDARIKRYFEQWRASDELQDVTTSATSYIDKMINAGKKGKHRTSRKTIERRLSTLGLPWQRTRQ